MALIPWIQWTERMTGENHPTREDSLNRALKQLLLNSGVDPNSDGIGILTTLSSVGFSQLTGLPTTLAGYGISDAFVPARANVVVTTASLANLAEETGTVALGKSFLLLKVAADVECRIRLYKTSAERTADSARAIGVDPTAGLGIICDLVPVAGTLTLDLAPLIHGNNGDVTPITSIYYAIQNRSGGTSTVQVTFTNMVMEP